METFIKFYVLISLWFWAGMLLSSPLRKAFSEMHLRLAERSYDATIGQVETLCHTIAAYIAKRYKKATLYVEERSYDLRVKLARSLVSTKLLDELTHKNFIAAISRARQMDQADSGVNYDELEKLVQLVRGKSIERNEKETAVKTAFKLSDTVFLREIITKMPNAQERILLAFEQAEGDAPYDSVKNEEFRKFIRE